MKAAVNWLIFFDKTTNKELVRITAAEVFPGEIESTKELVAHENGVDAENIGVLRSQGDHGTLWAGKWFADRDTTDDLSDALLKKAFEGCVLPPHPVLYPQIRAEILRIATERH